MHIKQPIKFPFFLLFNNLALRYNNKGWQAILTFQAYILQNLKLIRRMDFGLETSALFVKRQSIDARDELRK